VNIHHSPFNSLFDVPLIPTLPVPSDPDYGSLVLTISAVAFTHCDEVAMKIIGKAEIETVVDVVCDACASSTRVKTRANEYGVVHARWGYGSSHDGERYELHLCEECFFRMIAYIKQERRCHTLFAEDGPDINKNLGLITKDDYFGDSDH
jgi:hypothetical protein